MMSLAVQTTLILGTLGAVAAELQGGNVTLTPTLEYDPFTENTTDNQQSGTLQSLEVSLANGTLHGRHGGMHKHGNRVVCYLAAWAKHRPGKGKFTIEDIDATLCTNLIYCFIGIDEETSKAKSLDTWNDIDQKGFERAVGLKKQNPDLQVTVGIGGYAEGPQKFSSMAAKPALRKTFIDSMVIFIKEHKFDGLDLDWQFPAEVYRGGAPEDKENFVILVKELRQEFDKHDWLLTTSVTSKESISNDAYNVKELANYLEYIHVLAYDFHGKWDGRTGHNAQLYLGDDKSEAEKTLNADYAINKYLQLGCPPEKMIMGLSLYGRTYRLQKASNPQLGAPSQSTSFAGPYTKEDGFLGYNEICEKQKTKDCMWKIVRQKGEPTPYMFMEDMWVSYDDDKSLHYKTAFAKKKGLAGVHVWSIDTDDFMGTCYNKKFPLLQAINNALADKEYQPHKPELDNNCQKLTAPPKVLESETNSAKTGSSSTFLGIIIAVIIVVIILGIGFCIIYKKRNKEITIQSSPEVTMQSVEQNNEAYRAHPGDHQNKQSTPYTPQDQYSSQEKIHP